MRAGMRLGRGFFERYAPDVARDMIGCRLVRVLGGRRLAGTIVETEAYRGSGDPASHAFRGKTRRNEVMFGPAGHAYVYFTMGRHYCLNITTEVKGPAAVLVRALEPTEGIEAMIGHRGVSQLTRLASGPGNLSRALEIDGALNGTDVVASPVLFLERGARAPGVGVSSRVGISRGTSLNWRFYAKGNPFVSSGRPSRAQNP